MTLRRTPLLLAVAVSVATAPAGDENPSAAADVAALRTADYAVRAAAQSRLTAAGEDAFEEVVAAVGDRGEAGERAANVLAEWAFAQDGPFAERCERELYRLADEGAPEAAVRAAGVLSANRALRVKRGVESLEELGATCACFEPYLAAAHGRRPQRPDEGNPVVVLEKPFRGSAEDLWLLRRFSEVPGVAVYCTMRELNDGDVAAATADMTGVLVQFRGGALAIRGNSFERACVISSVTAGEAADRAGLGPQDVVWRMNDTPITRFDDLVQALYPLSWEDEVTLRVQRGNVVADVDVKLSKWADMAPTLNRPGSGRDRSPPKTGIPDHWRVVSDNADPPPPPEDPLRMLFGPQFQQRRPNKTPLPGPDPARDAVPRLVDPPPQGEPPVEDDSDD